LSFAFPALEFLQKITFHKVV